MEELIAAAKRAEEWLRSYIEERPDWKDVAREAVEIAEELETAIKSAEENQP